MYEIRLNKKSISAKNHSNIIQSKSDVGRVHNTDEKNIEEEKKMFYNNQLAYMNILRSNK